ncbi:hypothetical protein VIGAN_11130400, partial [Vigna angularis var. angularis]
NVSSSHKPRRSSWPRRKQEEKKNNLVWFAFQQQHPRKQAKRKIHGWKGSPADVQTGAAFSSVQQLHADSSTLQARIQQWPPFHRSSWQHHVQHGGSPYAHHAPASSTKIQHCETASHGSSRPSQKQHTLMKSSIQHPWRTSRYSREQIQ